MLETVDSRENIAGKSLFVRRLYHVDPSPKAAPVLVFLHEGLGCMAFWKDFPQRLCEMTGLDGLLYDRQGYGRSSAMDLPRGIDYLHVEAFHWLPALLDQLDVADIILVGHSDGGTIALLYAGTHPDRVRCLATEAAHVFVDPVTRAGIRGAVDAYQTGRLRGILEAYHGDKTDIVFRTWADTWLSEWFQDWNITDALDRVTSPALVIQGDADVYGTIDQVNAIAGGVSGPAETFLVHDCGHAPHNDAPDSVLAVLSEFVIRHGAPRGCV